MAKGFIKAEGLVEEFNNSEEIKEQFKSLYMYALYICSGDFSSFDNPLWLEEVILETKEGFKVIEL